MKISSKTMRSNVIVTFMFIQISMVGCGTARTLKPAFEKARM